LENTVGITGVFGFPNSVDLYCFHDKVLVGFSSDEFENVEIDPEISQRVEDRAY